MTFAAKEPFLRQARSAGLAARTLAIAAVGGLVALGLGLPAPFLSGGMAAVGAAAMARVAVVVPRPVVFLAMVVLGTAMGSAVTPDLLAAMWASVPSLAVLVATIPIVTWASMLVLQRFFRFDRASAFYASAPGALSVVMLVAAARGADVARAGVVQVFRLFALVAVLPPAIVLAGLGGANTQAVEATAAPGGLAVLLGAALLAALVLDRLRVPAGALIGAMAVSAALHAGSLVPGRVPDALMTAALIATSAMIGSRFGTVAPKDLLRTLDAAACSFAIALFVSLIGAILAWRLADVPLAAALVAFAPGGLEAMVILGFLLGLDPAYVAAHHVTRFLILGLGLPFLARLLIGKASPPSVP